ncbi:MAG: amidohydrolase [Anaerolineae bacterium]|nr:amidohydrolase [Thermoflexales bacterium]MDW8396025.1 amidohydrolase [Anaerolineae bacterium]
MSTLVLHNARIYTLDPRQPWAQAAVLKEGRVAWVGREDDLPANAPRAAEAINLSGRLMLPGLIDAHFHLVAGARWRFGVQLDAARSVPELQTHVRAFAEAHPDRPWITGRGWQYSAFGETPIHRRLLDEVVPDRPVFLNAFDGHTAWVNTRALKLAGLLDSAPTSLNFGQVVVDADGTPTGELREPPAMDLVRRLIPPLSEDDESALLRQVLRECAAYGITAVHNMDNWDDGLRVLRAFESRNELTVRVYLPFSVEPGMPESALEEWEAQTGELRRDRRSPEALLRTGSMKFFADGVIEAKTAWMVEPYADGSSDRGSPNFEPSEFKRLVCKADALGYQVCVHAIGDAAVRLALDAFAEAAQRNGQRDSRHRIEHIEVYHPADLHRFRELGILGSVQPLHAEYGADLWRQLVGASRLPFGFAWHDLLNVGAPIAFGSDWPVVTMNPYEGMRAGLFRQPLSADAASHRLTLPQLLDGYTRSAAYFEFAEDTRGMIAPGYLADIIVLDRDLFEVASNPGALVETRSVLTLVGGRVVHNQL